MTFQLTRVAALIALTFSMISPNNANYLEEYPVKMLSVEALAVRIPAADSKYRVSITNGFVSILHSPINGYRVLYMILYKLYYGDWS